MLAALLAVLGVAAVGSALMFDEEQTVDTEGDDTFAPETIDGADDLLASIELGSDADDVSQEGRSPDDVVVRFDDSSLEKTSNPLDDWTQSESLPIISGDQTLFLEFSEDLNGSLFSMDANYAETIQSGENAPIQTNLAQNVYFVPEGETFPPDYEWSTEGNSLYNAETHVDDVNAFGGIKLVARLDGGSFVSAPDGTLLQDQTSQLPTLSSNLLFS